MKYIPKSISMRECTDITDRGYDFSLLNAVSTCPFYGIVRHIKNKVFNNTDRNLALECGELCHKCFAAYRAYSIYQRGEGLNKPVLCEIGFNYLVKLFQQNINFELDEDSIRQIIGEILVQCNEKTTLLAKYTLFSDWIIDNSGYYEDPDDKKRTIANIKDSLLNYCGNFINQVQTEPVWIENEEDVNSKIGIEIPFNYEVDITYNDNQVKTVHFIGRLDGLHYRLSDNDSLIVHENKTASRLDDSWSDQWFKSHQITGYCLAASYFTNNICLQARVLGMQIPQPKFSGVGYRTERVDRDTKSFDDWARWVLHCTEIIDDYKDTPELAPMNTHACCKYYKACAFLPLCVDNAENRKRVIETEMVDSPWSPLDD